MLNASKTKYMIDKPKLRGKNRKKLHDLTRASILSTKLFV